MARVEMWSVRGLVVMTASVVFSAASCSEAGSAACSAIPCPYPGWDPKTCACRPNNGSDAGACRPVVAHAYDPTRDCYRSEQTLAGLCFRETEPNGSSGVAEVVCLVASDGTRYVTRKGYTECLEGNGWSTRNTAGVGQGWSVEGAAGLCERNTHFTFADGAAFDDRACDTALARGRWSIDALGNPLVLLDGGAQSSDAGTYAGECK